MSGIEPPTPDAASPKSSVPPGAAYQYSIAARRTVVSLQCHSSRSKRRLLRNGTGSAIRKRFIEKAPLNPWPGGGASVSAW